MGGIFEIDKTLLSLETLKEQNYSPEVWNEPEKARNIAIKIADLEKSVKEWINLKNQIQDLKEFIILAEEENDDNILISLEQETNTLQKHLNHLEVEILLRGEMDISNAFLNIHPGAGGTESQDWGEMLLRMYQRWASKKGFEVEIISLEMGDDAGIKDATLLIKGRFAFGYLTAENGIHRLVRLSPFNAQNKRQTSFCAVSISPEVDDKIEIAIDEKDLRIDTFRASGAGGQHVNKVSSAVRITHIPTNTVVSCQAERSQFQNKDNAMRMLRSKLYALERKKRAQESAEKSLDRKSVEWGNQIRSYVFQPYTMVKDHRTQIEKTNIQAVMDGDLDDFIIVWLKQHKIKNI
ncbi:peptide chain release factor 2 [Brevinema andersonii]|uniref:peptide chain release factor 2 n=1 Tax=Brevinema andersonii TaxID=34097 RepID=UPI000B822625|nr:peptide chain release factor 2 [Brevinema andersonii]